MGQDLLRVAQIGAAARSSDPLMGALAAWARTTSMLQNGSYDIGLKLLDRMQTGIEPVRTASEKVTHPVSGSLHLRSGMLAAHALRRPFQGTTLGWRP